MLGRRAAIVALGLAVGAGSGACSTRVRQVARPRASLLEDSSSAGVFESPAYWRYHPKVSAALHASAEVDAHTVLFAGDGGERWIRTLGVGTTNATVLRPASDLAREALVAIVRLERGWGFVGASGTVHTSETPLGSFMTANSPPRRLVRVAAEGRTLLGVTTQGGLLRSADGGSTWSQVALDEGAVDVAFDGAAPGTALLLTRPEQLWSTGDAGVRWDPLGVPTHGAFALTRGPRAEIVVRGVLGAQSFDPLSRRLSPLGALPAAGKLVLGAAPARGPDAAALRLGRAILIPSGYFEVIRRGSKWSLLHGPFDRALRERPLPLGTDCAETRITGFGSALAVACIGEGTRAEARAVSLYRSMDAGVSFSKLPVRALGILPAFAFALGPDGALVLTGLCDPEAGPGCAARGLQYLNLRGEGAPGLSFSAVPSLGGLPLRVLFSPNGRTVLALARRSKNGALAVFVSRDAGKSFVARELGGFDVSDDEPSAVQVHSFDAAEDGSVAAVLQAGGVRSLVVLDDDGRVITVAKAPEPRALLAAAGHRALALSHDSGVAFESLDGGVSWERVGRAPVPVCQSEEDGECNDAIQCRIQGCVVGSRVSRIGWHGQRGARERVLPPPPVLETTAPEDFRQGLSCSLHADAWRPLPLAVELPAAARAALGDDAWAVMTDDPAHASAGVLHVTRGARARLVHDELLPKLGDPDAVAYVAVPQIEGVAALRYLKPTGSGSSDLRNVEVAWDNRLTGDRGRGRLAVGGPYRVGDFVKDRTGVERANPALLSIAGNALYLTIHAGSSETQDTYYFSKRGVERLAPVSWPAIDAERSYLEYARLSGQHVPLRILARGQGLVRAERVGSGFAFDAAITGLRDPEVFGLVQRGSLVYHGGELALHVHTGTQNGRRVEGRLFPLNARGNVTAAAAAAPTQLDLGSRPTACRVEERRDSARLVVPPSFGTRHPVVVSDATEPLRLMVTAEAVLFGTPLTACAAAYEAAIVVTDTAGGTRDERALFLLDDLENAWLFRGSARPAGRPRASTLTRRRAVDADDGEEAPPPAGFEYRRMSCRFDPDLDVPLELRAALAELALR